MYESTQTLQFIPVAQDIDKSEHDYINIVKKIQNKASIRACDILNKAHPDLNCSIHPNYLTMVTVCIEYGCKIFNIIDTCCELHKQTLDKLLNTNP